jgi:tetratricopeptide (TPR) repeat protein
MRSAKESPPSSRRDWLAAGALAAITFAVFFPALSAGFVDYDDPLYVSNNPDVKAGLSAAGIRWAFTTYHAANWHPLTWLSLQLDATLWGNDPRGFHLTSVLLHAANAALLFLTLRSLTGAFWRSAAVALLFAVHPLRVESVAWVAERKDVLSTLFGLLALWAYAGYARSPTARRYLTVAALCALSLLAKPMLVTLPCLLLVLDWWPLGRAGKTGDWARLVAEKLPLFALATASCVVTALAQDAGRAVMSLEVYPPAVRAENALVGYTSYLFLTVWPTRLAAFYPHPHATLPVWQVAGAATLLAALTAGAAALRRRAPYLLVGWLWFLGTLVPVIGLVQVGLQAYADRYTYFPQVGVLLAVCWGVADLAGRRPRLAVAAAGVTALALAGLTWNQALVWHDSLTLWLHGVAVTRDNAQAFLHLADEYSRRGDYGKAAECYRKILVFDPTSASALSNLGAMLRRQGQLPEAEEVLDRAVRLHPGFASARTNLGNVYFQQKRFEDAEREYEEAARLDPQASDAYANLGAVADARRDYARAADCYRKALAIRPDFARAREGLLSALDHVAAASAAAGRYREAAAAAREALDQAGVAGRPDVVRQIEVRLRAYERAAGEASP